MKVKSFNKFNENSNDGFNYDVETTRYSDEQTTKEAVNYYKIEVERATNSKVISIEGESGESDSDLVFKLDSGYKVELEYIFHPFSPKMTITVYDERNNFVGRNTHGTLTGNPSYSGFEGIEDDTYQMIKDIYDKNVEKEPTHYISIPKESYGSEGFSYDFQHHPVNGLDIYFHSEEDAKSWLDSLKIHIFEKQS